MSSCWRQLVPRTYANSRAADHMPGVFAIVPVGLPAPSHAGHPSVARIAPRRLPRARLRDDRRRKRTARKYRQPCSPPLTLVRARLPSKTGGHAALRDNESPRNQRPARIPGTRSSAALVEIRRREWWQLLGPATRISLPLQSPARDREPILRRVIDMNSYRPNPRLCISATMRCSEGSKSRVDLGSAHRATSVSSQGTATWRSIHAAYVLWPVPDQKPIFRNRGPRLRLRHFRSVRTLMPHVVANSRSLRSCLASSFSSRCLQRAVSRRSWIEHDGFPRHETL